MPGERPFYYVPDGGRFTVLQRNANGPSHAFATMISEVQAISLSSLLNTLYVEREEANRTCRRWQQRSNEIAEQLGLLVCAVDQFLVNTASNERGQKLSHEMNAAQDLLEVSGQSVPS